VPRRVKEHAERRARLVLVPGRAELKHRCLGAVKVVDDDIEVHLLRHLLPGPPRRGVGTYRLEGDALAVVRADIDVR
jgi:hypothetical protein